jgi:formylglycine-generating enzyme required for sulfatase activity
MYKATDGRENLNARREVGRVLRGGAFDDNRGGVRCAYRFGGDPSNSYRYLGFRVVVLPAS